MTSEQKTLPLEQLVIDHTLQPRIEGLDRDHVQALQEAPDTWQSLVVVQRDDQYIVVDGFHRFAAAQQLGETEVACEVQAEPEGGDLKALAFALNRDHGKSLTRADRKAEAERLLRAEGSQWSDVRIARHCQFSDKTIGKIRGELEATSDIPRLVHRTGADGKVRPVSSRKANRSVGNQAASGTDTTEPRPGTTAKGKTAAATPSDPSFTALRDIVNRMTGYTDDHAKDDLAEALTLAIKSQQPQPEWSEVAKQLELWGTALLATSKTLRTRAIDNERSEGEVTHATDTP